MSMTATESGGSARAEQSPDEIENRLRPAGVRIVRLDDVTLQQEAVRLLCRIWQSDTAEDLVGPSMLRALDFSDNYVYGSSRDGRLTGVAVGFRGDGHLHSHMVGVIPEERATGTAYALKMHQRAWALRRGIVRIDWTFDPLVARNAFFNLQKLGAHVVEYRPDFYGELADGLNAGDASDRVLARWDLDVAGPVPDVLPEQPDDVLVAMPGDIEALRMSDPAAAARWRLRVREQLQNGLEQGRWIAGVTRAGAYVLRRGAEEP